MRNCDRSPVRKVNCERSEGLCVKDAPKLLSCHTRTLRPSAVQAQVLLYGERSGSPTRRHRRATWNRGAIAGFGASVGSTRPLKIPSVPSSGPKVVIIFSTPDCFDYT